MQSNNPLAKHFRQPAIYLTLPSKGSFWADNALDLPLSGQIPVFAMTTRDEIMIRTPDALLNGESVVQVIQSCCPQIKDAWKMPSIDVDAVLIAIRIASYGEHMDLDSVCPNNQCNSENTHQLSLTKVLDDIHAPNYNQLVHINDIKIKLRPQSYFEGNRSNLSSFEEQRLAAVISDEQLPPDQKQLLFKQHMERVISINLDIISTGTEYIETAEGQRVFDQTFIREFYEMTDSKVLNSVRKQFAAFAQAAALPQPRVKCQSCDTEYPIEITFDYTRFFVNAS